ncbi:MAG: hypothetical protein ACKON9_09725, partial [Planctomycetaceae bacterium]
EYSCFSCHHNLEDRSWYQQRRSTGRPGWETWALTPLRNSKQTEMLPLTAALQSLADHMNTPVPDRTLVKQAAVSSAAALVPVMNQHHPWTPAAIDQLCLEQIRLARRTTTDGKILAAGSWDEMAQLYLALRAASIAGNSLAPDDTRQQQIAA